MNETALVKDRHRSFSLSHDVLFFTHDETDFGNPPWQKASHRVLVVRLSPFGDVAESRPHLFLFDEVRRELPGAYIDFAFFPKQRDIPILGKTGLPWLCGIASGHGALDFDILLMSNAFTLELVNLMPALAGSKIPPRRSDRADGNFPYILLGGSNAFASGSLLDIREGKIADSVPDAFFFGEGEKIAGKLVADILAARNDDEYFRLAQVHTGFYPVGYENSVVQASFRGSEPDISSYPVLAGENADTVRMDISSGCPSFCTFCFESWERKPYREYSHSSLASLARKLKVLSGSETLELSSYNFNTHSDITGIISSAASVFRQVNFMSQRVDILAEHPELVDFEIAGGKRSFTLGIEGISERMRSYYNKELSFPEIRAVFSRLLKSKVREIKLFYIISGFETDDDLRGFEREIAELASMTAGSGYTPSVVLSTGFLVRMPFTPLGYERLILDEAVFEDIGRRLDRLAKEHGFDSRAPHYFDEYLATQLLALAPPGSIGLLEDFFKSGIVLDGSLAKKSSAVLASWLEGHKAVAEKLREEKPRDYVFTFSFVRRPVSDDFLYERYVSAKARRAETSCFRLAGHESDCAGCGACADSGERESLLNHSIRVPGYRETEALRALVGTKQKLPAYLYQYRIPEERAFAPKKYIEARFFASILAVAPELVASVYSVKDMVAKKLEEGGRLRNASGSSIVCLYARGELDPQIADQLGLMPCAGLPGVQSPEASWKSLALAISAYTPERSLFEKLFGEFLGLASIPFTLRKKADYAEFLIPEKGRKKKNIFSARIQNIDDRTCAVHAHCGSKLDLRDFIRLLDKLGIRIATRIDKIELGQA